MSAIRCNLIILQNCRINLFTTTSEVNYVYLCKYRMCTKLRKSKSNQKSSKKTLDWN